MSFKKIIFLIFPTLMLSSSGAWASSATEDVVDSMLYIPRIDTIIMPPPPKKKWITRAFEWVDGIVSPPVDTTYIETQKYNWAVMLQGTMAIDKYTVYSADEYNISFTQKNKIRVGPYFGWRWLFFGYTFDVALNNIDNGSTDFNFNLYSSAFGINLMYRKIKDYRIDHISIKGKDYTEDFKNSNLPGLNIESQGINLYYVLNHKKYSHQATYSQTNRQIKNAGSVIVGGGFDHHRMTQDANALNNEINNILKEEEIPDDIHLVNEINYSTVSIAVGYGHNWAFAKNWAVGGQIIAFGSYMWSNTNTITNDNFVNRHLTADLSLRLGLVWNNSRWFAGANAIANSYNYHSENFLASNNFGTVNVYVGYNFGKR